MFRAGHASGGAGFSYGAGRSSQLFCPLENTFYVLLMINNDYVFSDGYRKTWFKTK